MFLSGLQSIDFQGLGSLGGVISGSEAADLVWAEMPWGTSAALLAQDPPMSPEQFKAKVSQALSSGYRMTQSSGGAPSGVLDNSVLTSQYPANAGIINTVLETLKSKGYYIVSAQAAQPAAQSDSIAYRGAIAAQQAGSPSAQTQAQPAAVSSVNSTSPVQIQPRQSRATIYKRVPYKQTAAEKQRLIWIIGGFGVLFAVAIGVIASRD